jgi:ElaB/YqjD/DUF883 family membrane-anchored ribosome-binding protein
MEVYFKDLISKEASLEKLVDDLSMIVQGADDYARAVGANVSEQAREEVIGQLQSLKARCLQLKQQALVGARATDKMLRKHPYSSLAITFAAGLLIGATLLRRK